MAGSISIGDVAPNFDLSSTEDVLLMLRDEVVRTPVVLYFFADPDSERCRRDLQALARRKEALARLRSKVLAVAPLPLDRLKELQRELDLRFPLLRDDRGFAADYGVTGAGEDAAADPALVVVDRRQQVRLLSNPVASVEDALPQVEKLLAGLPSATSLYPRSVVNRLVDRWVN